jgi:hypothetical protein
MLLGLELALNLDLFIISYISSAYPNIFGAALIFGNELNIQTYVT